VTSIERLIGRNPGMDAVKPAAVSNVAEVFGMKPVQMECP